jgi:hypothetical protein
LRLAAVSVVIAFAAIVVSEALSQRALKRTSVFE